MGCWGITAFESDTGLDAVDFIRKNLPEDGKLDLGKIICTLQQDEWNKPDDVKYGPSHTSSMALAEIMVKFIDRDIGSLDYDKDWAAKDSKFSEIASFTASKESLQWLRDFLSDTLRYAKENEGNQSEFGPIKWGGWFKQEDWVAWQGHMAGLVGRLDSLIAAPGDQLELISPQEQGPIMGQNLQ